MRINGKLRSPIRRILMLISIPLALSSTGYALFSQQLSVTADVTNPAYSSSQNLRVTYTKAISQSGSTYTYHITTTITNNGTTGVTSWQSDYSLPNDFSAVSCNNSICSQSATTNVAVDNSFNGTINPGGSVVYDLYFSTANANYLFTSLSVSGTPTQTYQTVSGLSVSVTSGTQSFQNGKYITPYTFTVSNASGQNLNGWRILAPWDTATRTVESMATTVDYGQTATELTILSKQAIADAGTLTFNASLSSTDSTYVLTGQTIQGQL